MVTITTEEISLFYAELGSKGQKSISTNSKQYFELLSVQKLYLSDYREIVFQDALDKLHLSLDRLLPIVTIPTKDLSMTSK